MVPTVRSRCCGRCCSDCSTTIRPWSRATSSVLCPDIETFAPLIAATFGLDSSAAQQAGPAEDTGSAEHPGHRLRVRLADRSLRRVNPLLSVLERLLDLADSRLPASALLDLASTPPVASRFGFSEDDLQRLTELITAAGVRWGLDARQRGRFGLESFGQNTWAAGLDRILLGVTMDSEGEYYIGTALPLDQVDSGDVELVGRIAELVARVATFSRAVTGIDRRPLSWWTDACRRSPRVVDRCPGGRRVAERSRVRRAGPACRAGRPGPP